MTYQTYNHGYISGGPPCMYRKWFRVTRAIRVQCPLGGPSRADAAAKTMEKYMVESAGLQVDGA